MSEVKRISSNISWLTISEIGSKIIGFVFVIIIARYLKTVIFGQYSFAISFGIIFSVVAEFGLGTLLTREVARDKNKAFKYLGNLFVLKIFISVLTFGLIYLSVQFFNKPENIEYLVYLAGLNIILISYNTFFRSVFRAFEKMKYETYSRLIERIALLLLTILVVIFNLGVISIFWALIIGEAISFIYTLWILNKKFTQLKPQYDFAFWKAALKPSIYFTITGLFINIYFKIDVIMLSTMKNDQITGLYSAAYDLMLAFLFVPTVLAAAVYPLLSNFYKNYKERLQTLIPRLIKYFLIIGIPLSLGLLGLSKYLINILYGQDFSGSIIIFQYLSIALIFVFLNFIFSTLFNSIDKQKILTLTSGFGMVFNIAVNFILIPRYSATGAVIATILTEILLSALSLYYLNKYFNLINAQNLFKFLKIVLAGIFMALMTYLLRFEPILGLLAGFFGFAALLFLINIFTHQDKKYLREIIKK